MKATFGIVLALALPALAQDRPRPRVSLDDFRAELAPYGQWIAHMWRPNVVHSAWRPYSSGRWTHDPRGWTWTSSEPWGWATDHHGRWRWKAGVGWLWTPGITWAPARVIWRWDAAYAGWAPQGTPREDWARWVFVEASELNGRPVRPVALPARRARLVPARRNAPPVP